ncbi:hypothetical protein C8R42DRAFT_642602 [Lentinula raphanica]|nr:hypothetical protein C8R42DRAFT_642602 [Lentinula raphanica]
MADSLGISEAQILGLFLASDEMFPLGHRTWAAEVCLENQLAYADHCITPNGFLDLRCFDSIYSLHWTRGSDARFTGLTDWVNILKTCNIAFGKIISDGVLVYRCWVVYNHSIAVVVLPILLWLGSFATSIFIIYLEASAKNPKVLLTGGLSQITPSITASWSMSLANNIITTGLLVYRIWRVDRSNTQNGIWQGQETTMSIQGSDQFSSHTKRRKRTSKLQEVIRIIIESGMMYTTIALISFITFEIGSSSAYATSDVRTAQKGASNPVNRVQPHHHPGTIDTELESVGPSLSDGRGKSNVSNIEAGNWVATSER